MYCKNCGHELSNDAKFCSFCGTKTNDEVIDVKVDEPKIVYVEEKEESILNKPLFSKPETGPWKSFAKVGQILGIVFICCSVIPFVNYISLIFSELGIVFSALGMKSRSNHGKATTGLILNIIALVLSIILYFVYLFAFIN